ncbi:ATP-binding cassette domain-containing protein, partial [Streptomyces sp. NPDC001215]
MSDVLELEDVSVVREGRALVDQVSWSVKEGERWVILGPNGAGKTTLLNVASSYLYPTKGTATILGAGRAGPGPAARPMPRSRRRHRPRAGPSRRRP